MFQDVGEMVLLFWRTLAALPLAWRQRQKVFDQFFEIGNASLLMICILSFFIGGVIALQTGPLLVGRTEAGKVPGMGATGMEVVLRIRHDQFAEPGERWIGPDVPQRS